MMSVYGIAQVGLVVERKIDGYRKEQGDERDEQALRAEQKIKSSSILSDMSDE